MNTRYRIQEGSIELPEGFSDRSTNIFIFGNTVPSPINLNIARDALLDEETLPIYVDRQIALLKQKLRGFSMVRREASMLGSGPGALTGEEVTSTHKSGNSTLHQRQAAFLSGAKRVLIFSCTSARRFDGTQQALWQQWLTSFQSTTHN
jgi:hypothetical protein